MLPPGRQARCTSTWMTTRGCLPPGLTGSMRSGHRNGFCGAPWNRTSTSSRIRFSMCLSRRWGTSWWKCSERSTLDRSAQGLSCQCSTAPCGESSSAVGGAAGGSADGPWVRARGGRLEALFEARTSTDHCRATGRRGRRTWLGFLTDHVMVGGCDNDASHCQYWIVRSYCGILTIGLCRVVVGALNVESQCSWAALPWE